MNQKPSALDYISTLTKALLSVICVVAICAAMFYKNYSDPATLSALFLLTGTLIGGLRGSQLAGKSEPNGDTTTTQTTQTTTTPKAKTPPPIQEVKVVNDPSKPEDTIPVAEKPNPVEPPPVQST